MEGQGFDTEILVFSELLVFGEVPVILVFSKLLGLITCGGSGLPKRHSAVAKDLRRVLCSLKERFRIREEGMPVLGVIQ